MPDGRVLGAQAVGLEGVEKRIDVIATTIQMGGTVHDLAEAELCYAPQFGAAKDPVNLAGMIAANHLNGDMPLADWRRLGRTARSSLDVREPDEFAAGHVAGRVNLPLSQLRERYGGAAARPAARRLLRASASARTTPSASSPARLPRCEPVGRVHDLRGAPRGRTRSRWRTRLYVRSRGRPLCNSAVSGGRAGRAQRMLDAYGDAMMTHATRKRSVVKALSYRVLIVSLDFTVIFLLTGKTKVAVGFMIVSNIYTTVGYFLHERLWARIASGIVRLPTTLDARRV